jgi:hypothetical protein
MKNLITRKLTALASEFLQTRFIGGATTEVYLLPDEILNDAYDCIRLVTNEAVSATGLDDEERSAVVNLKPYLDRIPSIEAFEPEALIATEEWREARHRSGEVIALLGGDLSALEQALAN